MSSEVKERMAVLRDDDTMPGKIRKWCGAVDAYIDDDGEVWVACDGENFFLEDDRIAAFLRWLDGRPA